MSVARCCGRDALHSLPTCRRGCQVWLLGPRVPRRLALHALGGREAAWTSVRGSWNCWHGCSASRTSIGISWISPDARWRTRHGSDRAAAALTAGFTGALARSRRSSKRRSPCCATSGGSADQDSNTEGYQQAIIKLLRQMSPSVSVGRASIIRSRVIYRNEVY
jgi:hypothetical protein